MGQTPKEVLKLNLFKFTIKKAALACFLLLLTGNGASASHNVGDIIGKVLSTDIVTYINDTKVASYNIAGRTAIIAQDLSCFEFAVEFNEAERRLSIKEGKGAKGYLSPITTGKASVGTAVGNVYYTDIVTYYEDVWIESFNIGGLTCVFADDLAKMCGATYVWDDNERTVKITKKNYVPTMSKTQAARVLDTGEIYAEKEFSLRRWGKAKSSHITQNDDGGYTVVEVGEHINIEKYDASFNLTESYAIARELPIFGALYFGKDYNYIAFGQENFSEDNSREIIKIVIYDKDFVKISEVPVYNCKTTVPFDAGSAQLSESGEYLVLHASRSQYADEHGARPQTQLTVIINKADWSVNNMLGKYQPNHTSHSLRQHVRVEGENIITLDLCDTAPYRGAVLSVLDPLGNTRLVQSIFNAGGPLGANCTGVMTGGLEITNTGYLAVINTIDHSLPTSYDSVMIGGIEKENRDIYLIWTNKETGEIKHNCLARYTGLQRTGSVPHLVDLEDGTYAVLWQEYTDGESGIIKEAPVNCVISDENGNVLTETVKISQALLSDSCTPVKAGNALVWYVNTEAGREFYSLNLSAVKGSFDETEKTEAEQKPQEPHKPADNKAAEEKTEAETEEKPKKEILEVDGI